MYRLSAQVGTGRLTGPPPPSRIPATPARRLLHRGRTDAMLLIHDGRRLYYDLMGPEKGPVVCFTHSLSSDGGMWAEQVPLLLGAGYRVLRLDMRGHGGSDP